MASPLAYSLRSGLGLWQSDNSPASPAHAYFGYILKVAPGDRSTQYTTRQIPPSVARRLLFPIIPHPPLMEGQAEEADECEKERSREIPLD